MIKPNHTANSTSVTGHIQKLPPEVAETVEYLRQLILKTDKEIGEQIKWNSPSFYYTGEMKAFDAKEYKRDLIVMNVNRGKILLVLPTGASIKDDSGILEGSYTDGRRLITIKDLADAQAKQKDLRVIIQKWLALIEK